MGKFCSGEWKPGTKISTEEQLCAELSFSRITVRQTLKKLSALSVCQRRDKMTEKRQWKMTQNAGHPIAGISAGATV